MASNVVLDVSFDNVEDWKEIRAKTVEVMVRKFILLVLTLKVPRMVCYVEISNLASIYITFPSK
jgi:hypothetical protein